MVQKNLSINTITVTGRFNGIKFMTDVLFEQFTPYSPIMAISCNQLYKRVPNYVTKYEQRSRNKSSRGRKPQKQRDKNNFNSQITFSVQSSYNDGNIYNVKLFQDGVVQIPGVLDDELRDVWPVIQVLRERLTPYFPNLELSKFEMCMINSNCTIFDNSKYSIDLLKLSKVFAEYIKTTVISSVIYDEEKPQTVTVKIPRNYFKQAGDITCKIFSSSKLNIDSAKTRKQSVMVFNLIRAILYGNIFRIIYTPRF